MTDVTGKTAIRHRIRRVESDLGVTKEMVIEVIKLLYDHYRDDDFPPFPEFLRDAHRDYSLWTQFFCDPDENFDAFGENAPKIRAVMEVAGVIRRPPPINSWTRVAAYEAAVPRGDC